MRIVLLSGVIFGIILQRARVNTFDTIGGFAMLRDFTVPKVILTAIAVSAVLLYAEVLMGVAGFHLKPLMLGGVVVGGILFGIGMAVLGYCPGTLIVSTGEGALDALIGTVVGIATGALFAGVYPAIRSVLGPDFGKIQLLPRSPLGAGFVVFLTAAVFILVARKLDSLD